MKKIYFSLFIFYTLLPINPLQAQWFENGTVWHYELALPFNFEITHQTITVEGDTFLAGQAAKILIIRDELNDSVATEFVYEQNRIVYWYNKVMHHFTTLYNFNAVAGDSWQFTLDSCIVNVFVDSTGYYLHNFDTLKILYLRDVELSGIQGEVIEQIGHMRTPFPDNNFFCDGNVVEEATYNGLLCFEAPSRPIIIFTPTMNCMPSGTTLHLNDDFLIYPNPANDFLIIKNLQDGITFEIYDINGRLMISEKSTSGEKFLNISQLYPGVYLVKWFNASGINTYKFIKH